MGNVKKSVDERTRHQRQYDRRLNKRQIQMQKSKIDTGKVVYADLVVTESSGAESEVQDDTSRLGNDTDADDADIRPIYDEEPMAEVQLTAECNIFKIGQQHTEQPEISNEGRVDQSKTIEQTTSLLANNVDLKAQIQEKIFPNKTSAVYEKTSPTSDLRWKPTSRIFKTVGLRWVPTGKILASCTSKDDSEPTHEVPTTDMISMTSMIELESLFGLLFDEYFNVENQVVSKPFDVTTADASNKRQQQPDSTSSTSTLATTVSADGNIDL
ncbi:hypothetical protein Tco_0038442 [Tanacetum coccineum]